MSKARATNGPTSSGCAGRKREPFYNVSLMILPCAVPKAHQGLEQFIDGHHVVELGQFAAPEALDGLDG